MDLTKKIDETELQYIWRLCFAKDSGTLDMTWDELADVLNKNLREDESEYYGSSAYRKKYQQAKLFRDEVFSKEETVDYQTELSVQKRELEKAKIKLQTEKLEYAKWLREEARDELILEKIIDAISNLQPLDIPQEIGIPYTERGFLLNFADLHYGVEFNIKGLFGETLNEYSPEICERRMWSLYNQVSKIIEKESIDTLHIINLSDNLDGILRISQLMKLRYGVVDATLKVSELLATWINELSKKVRIKYYMVMDSNHDELRLLDGKKGSFSDDNMDKIIFAFIKERLKNNPNVEIIENKTNMVFMNICDYNIAAIHGEVKNMNDALKEYSSIYNVRINYLIGGHLHHNKQEEVGFDCSVVNVGSVIGIDSYSLKLLKASNASAKLLCFEKGNGITVEYNIKLN